MFCYTEKGKLPVSGKIVVVGDSISDDGRYISFINSYFALCGIKDTAVISLGVSSENTCGLSEPAHPFPRPCAQGRIDRVLSTMKPDWVLLCYGVNDGIYYPLSQERFAAYKKGLMFLVEKSRASGAKVAVLTPPPFDAFSFQGELLDADEPEFSYASPYENYDEVMAEYSRWILEEMPAHADMVIDLRGPMLTEIQVRRACNPDFISGDGIHPNLHGHWVMAQTILRELCNRSLEELENLLIKDDLAFYQLVRARDLLLHRYYKEAVGHDNPNKEAPVSESQLKDGTARLAEEIEKYMELRPQLAENADCWNGYFRARFFFKGYEALLVRPKKMSLQNEWVWRTEFFGAFPSADLAMLEKGYAVAHLRIPNLYGNAEATGLMLEFQELLCEKFNLAQKAVLFGFSRGGLYAVNYAAMNPEKVCALYLDAPVVDMKSWPGGMGKGEGAPKEWLECRCAYGLQSAEDGLWDEHKERRLSALAAAKLPLIMVAGDSDTVVPYEENGALLARRYEETGAAFKLIIKSGVGHHPHSLNDPTEIIDFLISEGAAKI